MLREEDLVPINGKEDRTINITTPKGCIACGMKFEEYQVEYPKAQWLMITLRPGIVIFKCPKCHAAHFNPEAMENHLHMQEWAKEDTNRLVKLASGPLDPKGIIDRNLKLVGKH